jgi:hypothetical protein
MRPGRDGGAFCHAWRNILLEGRRAPADHGVGAGSWSMKETKKLVAALVEVERKLTIASVFAGQFDKPMTAGSTVA